MNTTQFKSDQLPKLQLDKNRRRAKQCPCGKSNKDGKFVPYKGYDDKGYCHSCGKNFLPELPEAKQLNNYQTRNSTYSKAEILKPLPETFIPSEIFKASLGKYDTNHFVTFLVKLFGHELTNKLISKYYIGTSKYWSGSTVFWQIDIAGKIRTGKIMLYNPDTGKRVKEPFNHISWVHKAIKQPDFLLKQCFFGEHLLIDKTKPVAIVESEKTAIISSAYFPQFIWLATGGSNGSKWTNPEVFKVLRGHKIILWPDIQSYDNWNEKSEILVKNGIHTSVSDLLEIKCTPEEREAKLDIADFLVRFPLNQFSTGPTTLPP